MRKGLETHMTTLPDPPTPGSSYGSPEHKAEQSPWYAGSQLPAPDSHDRDDDAPRNEVQSPSPEWEQEPSEPSVQESTPVEKPEAGTSTWATGGHARQPVDTPIVPTEALIDALRDRSHLEETISTLSRVVETLEQRVSELQGDQVQALFTPPAQAIITVVAQIDRWVRTPASLVNVDEEAESKLTQGLEYLADQLVDALASLGLSPVPVEVGQSFDRSIHKVVAVEDTGDESADRQVIAVQQRGFLYPKQKRAAFPAHVVVLKYKP